MDNSNTKRSSTPVKIRVLACGEITVGKGVDVFIRTARALKRISTMEFEFVWLGADTHRIRSYFETDIERLGLQDVVKFLGFSDSPSTYFQDSDLFFMCSRQDSFPLVCLEAASFGLPIVYFPEAGGIRNLLGEDAGFPIEYLNEEEAAQTMARIFTDWRDAKKRGHLAYQRWHSEYRSDVILGQVANHLRRDIYAALE